MPSVWNPNLSTIIWARKDTRTLPNIFDDVTCRLLKAYRFNMALEGRGQLTFLVGRLIGSLSLTAHYSFESAKHKRPRSSTSMHDGCHLNSDASNLSSTNPVPVVMMVGSEKVVWRIKKCTSKLRSYSFKSRRCRNSKCQSLISPIISSIIEASFLPLRLRCQTSFGDELYCTWAHAFIVGPCGGCLEAYGSNIIKCWRAIQFGMNVVLSKPI